MIPTLGIGHDEKGPIFGWWCGKRKCALNSFFLTVFHVSITWLIKMSFWLILQTVNKARGLLSEITKTLRVQNSSTIVYTTKNNIKYIYISLLGCLSPDHLYLVHILIIGLDILFMEPISSWQWRLFFFIYLINYEWLRYMLFSVITEAVSANPFSSQLVTYLRFVPLHY